MEKNKVITVVFGILLVAISALYLKSSYLDSRVGILNVVGEGKIKAQADLAQFTISYTASASTSADALDKEKNFRQKIITLLTGPYGVETENIQVSYPQVVSPALKGGSYRAVNSFDVNFKKLSLLDTAISRLYQIGGDELTISNIVFSTNNSRDLEDKAIAEAMKDAGMRAEKMAQASGKKLGKLISITGDQTISVGTITREASKTPPAGQTVEAASQIEIIRNVTLVYELK